MSLLSPITVFEDAASLAASAADWFAELASAAIARDGRFAVVLSGGSTPRAMHQSLAARYHDQIDWSKVYVYWGDERTVPPDHPESNYGMARETLLSRVPIPPDNIFRMAGERDPQAAAEAYAEILGATPAFHLVYLGMGDDGHTLSLFPYTTALQETSHLVVANYVEKLSTWRITLTAPAVNKFAENIAFLVAGATKAEALRHVLAPERQLDQYPSQRIAPEHGTLRWFVDRAAYPSSP